MSFLRSRQSNPHGGNGSSATESSITRLDGGSNNGKRIKGNSKWFIKRIIQPHIILACSLLLFGVVLLHKIDLTSHQITPVSTPPNGNTTTKKIGNSSLAAALAVPMGRIVYGAKSKGKDTSKLVKAAIEAGFRHIASGGFHSEYDEPGVGAGWKESGISRNELYLQTLFLANSVQGYGTQNCLLGGNSCPPSPDLSIEDQVHLSVKSSLHNLQTDFIDAVLVHNFRAQLQPYEETLAAWRVLEGYVDRGIVRQLGIVSVHDKVYLTELIYDARIKPSIIQNRFHSNRGYDIELRPFFWEMGLTNQLFWILTGSAGGRVRNNDVVKDLATKKGVSPQVLLYSFTMALGGTPLIGTKSLTHMKEDVEALLHRKLEWSDEEFTAMADVMSKNLVHNRIKSVQ